LIVTFSYPHREDYYDPQFYKDHPELYDPEAFNYDPIHTALSEIDKAYMIINYPRPSAHPNSPKWTFEHALSVAGVKDKKTLDILMGDWNKKNYSRLRRKFIQWNKLERGKKQKENALPSIDQYISSIDTVAAEIHDTPQEESLAARTVGMGYEDKLNAVLVDPLAQSVLSYIIGNLF
jgi:hypothetical protein